MCKMLDHYIFVSFRAGNGYYPPPGSKGKIPIGVFGNAQAGTRGIHIRYLLSCLDERAVFETGESVVEDSLYATQGGYRAEWDPNYKLNVSAMERISEGRVHLLSLADDSQCSEIRVPVRIEIEWQPLKSRFAQPAAFDQIYFTGARETSFSVIFPPRGKAGSEGGRDGK